ENVQRKNLNPIETAQLVARLCEPLEAGGGGLTITAAGELMGMSQEWASNKLRLLKLPPKWQAEVAAGKLNNASALRVASHADNPEFLDLVERDRAANPWAWKTVEDFERGLKQLASDRGLQLAARPPRAPRSAPAKRPVDVASLA